MYVLGRGWRHPGTGHVIIHGLGKGPFIVSTRSEDELRETFSRRMKNRYIGGGSLVVIGCAVFVVIGLVG